MKTMLFVVCGSIIILTLGHAKAEPERSGQISSFIDTLNFKTVIQPILQKNCSPCHFPGGKMYAKMPFDKGETIVSHQAGALKRFSDKKENALVRQFIEQSKVH